MSGSWCCHLLAPKRSCLHQHGLQMAALTSTRLDMYQIPQQTAEMNPSHWQHYSSVKLLLRLVAYTWKMRNLNLMWDKSKAATYLRDFTYGVLGISSDRWAASVGTYWPSRPSQLAKIIASKSRDKWQPRSAYQVANEYLVLVLWHGPLLNWITLKRENTKKRKYTFDD